MRRWLNEELARIDRKYRDADTLYQRELQRAIATGSSGRKPKMGELDRAFERAERLCLEILGKLDEVDIENRTTLGHAFNRALAEFDAAAKSMVPGGDRRAIDKPAKDWKPVVRRHAAWLKMTAGGGKYLTNYDAIKQVLEKKGCLIPSRSLLNSYRKKLRIKGDASI